MKYITRFEVENFKKFDHLVVEDISQFNLITGDNNSGKTCLLESLLVNDNIDSSIENMHYSLCGRQLHIHPQNINSKTPTLPSQNYFDYLKNNRKNNSISFKWKEGASSYNYRFEDTTIEKLNEDDFTKEIKHNYDIGRPKRWIKIYKNDVFIELQFMYLDDFKMKFNHGYLPFIRKNIGFGLDINHYYAEEVGLGDSESLTVSTALPIDFSLTTNIKTLSFDDKKTFLSNLSLFFDDVEDVMIKSYFDRSDILSLKLKRYEDYVPITQFGNGVDEFIRNILEIQKCKNKRIMIDEIATGIHFSKMQEFWKIIMQVATTQKVQLFASTHSKECAEAYIAAAGELGDIKDKVRLIELESLDTKTYASTYNYAAMLTGLYSNSNMRG